MTPWLGGKSVLIVEDEFLIGLMLIKEIALRRRHLDRPRDVSCRRAEGDRSRTIDLVILDAKLVDGSGADLAVCLEERRIPLCGGQRLRQAEPAEWTEKGPLVIAKPISVPVLLRKRSKV